MSECSECTVQGKTVSFHHGVLPKKGRTENPERQARKEKAREVRQEAARQAKADEEVSWLECWLVCS